MNLSKSSIKRQWFTSENYSLLLGLSCIENHILTLLKADGFLVELLYSNSFINMDCLWENFFLRKRDYAHFDGIERIQDMAKRYGVLSMNFQRGTGEQFIQTVSSSCHDFLMLLKPDVAQDQFNIRGWHEKHYVFVIPEEEHCHVINDIPFSDKTLFNKQLENYYGGEFFECALHCERYDEVHRLLKAERIHLFHSAINHTHIPDGEIAAFRDLIGVYRILLRRQKSYIGIWTNADFFDLFIKDVDSIFMKIEYKNIKQDYSDLDLYWLALLHINNAVNERIRNI